MTKEYDEMTHGYTKEYWIERAEKLEKASEENNDKFWKMHKHAKDIRELAAKIDGDDALKIIDHAREIIKMCVSQWFEGEEAIDVVSGLGTEVWGEDGRGEK